MTQPSGSLVLINNTLTAEEFSLVRMACRDVARWRLDGDLFRALARKLVCDSNARVFCDSLYYASCEMHGKPWRQQLILPIVAPIPDCSAGGSTSRLDLARGMYLLKYLLSPVQGNIPTTGVLGDGHSRPTVGALTRHLRG